MAVGPQNDDEQQLAERIRADTPNWPVEAVDGWLFEVAKGYGWPPDERWRHVLNLHPFERWRDVRWEREDVDLEGLALVRLSIDTITGLVRAYGGEANRFSNIVNSHARIDRIAPYIIRNGTLPLAPLLLRSGEGFELLDGSHRLAAFFMVKHWKATGELPADPPLRATHEVVIANAPADW